MSEFIQDEMTRLKEQMCDEYPMPKSPINMNAPEHGVRVTTPLSAGDIVKMAGGLEEMNERYT